jgi:F0F1-type ATP synthase assembly protein I
MMAGMITLILIGLLRGVTRILASERDVDRDARPRHNAPDL